MAVRPQDFAATLLKRARDERTQFAVRAEELRQAIPALIRQLIPGQRAWLIGSLDSLEWGVRSDVDIVVEGLPADRRMEAHAVLERALRATVDLLRLEDLDAGFRESVLERGRRIDVS